MDSTDTVALPSGKSLEEKTVDLLHRGNIEIVRPHPRSCVATVEGFPGLSQAIFAKPASIPGLVSNGKAAIGICGMDTMLEYGVYDERRDRMHEPTLEVCVELPYSRSTSGPTRCVLFTRNDNPVARIEDMLQDETVATEYPIATARLLFRYGIRATLQECKGSAETYVACGAWKYGVALVETGDTLRANGLKIIATVFESNTVLIANKRVLEDSEAAGRIRFLASLLKGVLVARSKVYLVMNAEAARVDEIKCILPGLRSPTIQALAEPDFVSIAAVVEESKVNDLMLQLSGLGASGFVLLPPSAIV